jgi:hypothetical protein
MRSRLISCVVAGALGATVGLTSPVQARGGGGMGGGMHAGGMGGGMHFGAMGGGMRFGGSRFADRHFVHSGFPSRSSRFAFRDRRFFRHDRFAFIGGPFLYDGDYGYYEGCWRRAWTSYGPQWVNVCGYY